VRVECTPTARWGGAIKNPAYFQRWNPLGLPLVLPPNSSSERQAGLAPPGAGAAPLREGGGGAPAVLSVSALRTQLSLPEPVPAREPRRLCRSVPARVRRGPCGAVGGVDRWLATS
jgi:hypothetical protein